MAYQDYANPGLVPNESMSLSKINSAGLINFRINEIWNDAHKHARKGQLQLWNEDLDRIWMELGADTEDGGQETKEIEKFDKAFSLASKEEGAKPRGFNIIQNGERMKLAKQKKALMQKELYLRRLQNKQGKGTAYHDGSEDYMD